MAALYVRLDDDLDEGRGVGGEPFHDSKEQAVSNIKQSTNAGDMPPSPPLDLFVMNLPSITPPPRWVPQPPPRGLVLHCVRHQLEGTTQDNGDE